MPSVSLEINGRQYQGWESVSITRGIEQLAGSFDLGVSELWPQDFEPKRIGPNDKTTVSLDDEPVIVGHVDQLSVNYTDQQHGVAVRGRDSTGDLVDCSAIVPAGELINQSLLQIARVLCEPFGIAVSANVDVGKPFDKWIIAEGETVFESLDRAARQRGVLLISDGTGGLLITRAGAQMVATALRLGDNVLSADGGIDYTNRYRKYIVKGQAQRDDNSDPQQITQLKGEAIDPHVERYRPLVVLAEHPGDLGAFQTRATWERNVHAGRSSRAVYTVQGWRHADGLWQPNQKVTVQDIWLRLDNRIMLITQVRYLLDGKGTRCELTLVDPAAFALIPLPEPQIGSLLQ